MQSHGHTLPANVVYHTCLAGSQVVHLHHNGSVVRLEGAILRRCDALRVRRQQIDTVDCAHRGTLRCIKDSKRAKLHF